MISDSVEYEKIKSAISLGESFLWQYATKRGWSDFRTPLGESSEWITGYILFSVARNEAKENLVSKIIQSLCDTQRNEGGWGFNPITPPDADSTAMVLNGFLNWGFTDKATRNALKFLYRLQDTRTGGFKTFESSLPLQFILNSFRTDFVGWSAPHTEVTAAAVIALDGYGIPAHNKLLKRAILFLKKSISKKGLCQPYWWFGPFYVTELVLYALSGAGSIRSFEIEKIITSLARLQREDGSWDHLNNRKGTAFATALAISSLTYSKTAFGSKYLRNGINWLLDHQRQDGSWTSAPSMLIPYPEDLNSSTHRIDYWKRDRLGMGVIIRDHRSLFTTATVVRSLYRLKLVPAYN